MKGQIQQRLVWVRLYEQTGDAGYVCRRCGISRPTLRKWWKRYRASGQAGLADLSKRPKSSPMSKVTKQFEELILEMRRTRNLGARRLQSELLRHDELSFSLATIHKVLRKHQVEPIKRHRTKKEYVRYAKLIPGDRVQLDTCKIGPLLYQYTAIDDCTRLRVLRLYSRRSAQETLDFLDAVIDEMPFPVQRIQTDRGLEFFAAKVQKR